MVSLLESAYLAVAFVVFVVTAAIGASVLNGVWATQYTTSVESTCTAALMQAGQTNCTTVASNATKYGLTGITNLANQEGTIGTILGAVIIIGLLMGAFMFKTD